MHGTNESPEIFFHLVCAAVAKKQPIVVGLERSSSEQLTIDEFTSNHSAPTSLVLSQPGWGYFDGRSSRAMLTLLERLRDLKLAGKIERVIAFGDSHPNDSAATVEETMATSLLNVANQYPKAIVIVLTGNLHASKREFAEIGNYRLTAMFLPPDQTLSLLIVDKGGEAWNQMNDGCKPHQIPSSDGASRGLTFISRPGDLAGYDALLATGSTATASVPALPNSAPPSCSTKSR